MSDFLLFCVLFVVLLIAEMMVLYLYYGTEAGTFMPDLDGCDTCTIWAVYSAGGIRQKCHEKQQNKKNGCLGWT